MSYLSDLRTIFLDFSMPVISMVKQGKDVSPAAFKSVDRLCNQIILEPEVKKSFFRTVRYEDEERLKDMNRLISKVMSYFHVRDALYSRVLDILK